MVCASDLRKGAPSFTTTFEDTWGPIRVGRNVVGRCVVHVCGAVDVCGVLWSVECVLMTCFAQCFLSGTMRSVLLEKHCPFSQTSNCCLFTFCDARGSKVPAIIKDVQQLDTERAVFSSFHKKKAKKRDLGNTTVETRLCRATLSCSGHKPACKRATQEQ